MGQMQGNVRQVWRRLIGPRGAVGIAILALLFTSAFVSGAVVVRNLRTAHANRQLPATQLRRPDPRAEGAWFQLSHFGTSHPTSDARIKALAEARQLPHSPLGARRSKSPSGAQWTPLGPQPISTTGCATSLNCTYYGLNSGRITALAVNPTNNNDIWVGAADGGLWHSTNGGTTWTPVTDNQVTLSIGAITIDPHAGSPYTIYAGTGEGNLNADAYWGDGILMSSDGGTTWSLIGAIKFAGVGINKLSVLDPDPQNGNHATILASATFDGFSGPLPGPGTPWGNYGVWRSTDGGATWIQVLTTWDDSENGTDGATDVVFDPWHPGVVYAALGNIFGYLPGSEWSSEAGIYKSTSSGEQGTWTRLTSGGAPYGQDLERISLGLTNDGTHTHIYAVIAASGLNGDVFGNLLGATFNASGTPTGGNIYVSADDGASWTAKNVVTGGAPEMANDDAGSQWWYDNYAAGDPTDTTGHTAYVGGVDVWKTSDGGSTWTNLTNAYNIAATPVAGVHPDEHAFSFFAGNSAHPSYFYIGNDGGIWSGTGSTGAGSFTNLNGGGLNITQFYGGSIGEAGTHPQLYGGSQDNGTVDYPTTPIGGAAQWNVALGGDGGDTIVDYTNNSVIYASNPGGVLWKSTDSGGTWSLADYHHDGRGFPGGTNFIMPAIGSPNNHLELLAASDQVFRTTNGTTTWSAISPPLDIYSCGTGYCAARISALAIAPGHDSTIYAGDNLGNVYITLNGGASWQTDNSIVCIHSMVTSLAVDPMNPKVAYASCAGFDIGGTGNHVIKTTDGGLHWTDASTTLPDIPVESILVSPNGSNVVIAGSDVGVFISQDGGSTWALCGTGLPNVAIDQIFTNHTGTELYVATHGRGMWSLDFPSLASIPVTITLTATPGSTPPPTTLSLKNTGFGALNWSLTSSLPSWIASVTPTSGSLAAGASQTLTVTFNALSATPQTYVTNLTYSDPNAINSPFNIPLTMVATLGSTNWYFAEGYTGGNATEYLTIANPDPTRTAQVQVTYLLGKGGPIVKSYAIGPSTRFTRVVNKDVGPGQNVSMIVQSTNGVPIVAERPYYVTYIGTFGSLPSGTDVLGATSLATQFDFANVDSSPGRDTWLTILNHNSSPMTVTINYFAQTGGLPTMVQHTVPANSRGTVAVQYEVGLPRAEYSATITLSESGLVERTLYEQADPVTGYPGAADVIGVASPQKTWDFAEGFISLMVNERYVLANPSTTLTAHATVTFYLPDGSAHSSNVQTLAPGQQVTVFAAPIIGNYGGDNSAVVTSSDNPILAERLMSSDYLGYAGANMQTILAPGLSEVLGASGPTHLAQFAEGYTGGQVAEYLTILNPDPTNAADVTVTFLPATGGPTTVEKYVIGPSSRFTLFTNSILPGAFFSMTVESNVPILAERPMSFVYNGFAPGSTDIIGYAPPGS